MKTPVCSQRANAQYPPKSAHLAIKFVRFYPSRYALYLLLLSHVAAILSVSIIWVPFWLRLALFLVVLLSLAKHIRAWLNQPTMRMQCFARQWYLVNEASNAKSHISDWHFLSGWVLVLVVRTPTGHRRYFSVFRDSCPNEHFRWTRVVANYLLG